MILPDRAGLARLGLDAVYGAPLDGVAVVDAPVDLAPLLAGAHRRVTRLRAGVHLGDERVVDPDGREVRAEPEPDPSPELGGEAAAALTAARAAVVLAGPGVVLDGAVPGLHALAAARSLGVLNTWGAKGVFDWRSPHHLATVGLQARDFERGGLAGVDLILATGIDEREARGEWRLAPVVEVEPRSLGSLAERLARRDADIAVPPLRADLARVTQAGWDVAAAPLQPTRATRHYSEVLGPGGLVAADPGVAGYWVARTYPTLGAGGALVPAAADARGFAIACALVARLADAARPVLAVVDVLGDVHGRLLDLAARLAIAVPVERWSADGDALAADAHLDRLRALVAEGGVASIATDGRQLDDMLAVAGPVVAWGGLPLSGR